MEQSAELFDYIRKPDPSYHWQQRGEQRDGMGSVYDLHLQSQTWRGIPWQHLLRICVPADIAYPDTAVLIIGADAPGAEQSDNGRLYAEALGVVCAFLYDVPNQPLFDGRIEDELIAYTLVQYVDTGEMDWPLLFPMARSAVAAMDTVQAFCRQESLAVPGWFQVSGASKRGWTTWLTAVVDPRVQAILPLVYDNLNVPVQLPHQMEMWGGYSEQISDYTEAGLPEKMNTERGYHLAQIIDPYFYRDRLTLPKLIINGANDRYWATDALNLYWSDLRGPKYVLYVPNAGHGLADPNRVFDTSAHFIRAIAAGHALPQLEWEYREDADTVYLALTSDVPAREAHFWVAHAPNKDFRASVWSGWPLHDEQDHKHFSGKIPKPAHGGLAVYAEIAFTHRDDLYTLSTQMHICHR